MRGAIIPAWLSHWPPLPLALVRAPLINCVPVDRQKPYALLKNKPKLKRGEKAPGREDENTEEDEFMGSDYIDDRYNNGNDRLNRNNRNNRNNNNLNMGGFQQTTGNRRRF